MEKVTKPAGQITIKLPADNLPASVPAPQNRYVHAFPLFAALTTFILAIAGILGWILDLNVLKAMLPGMPTMKPATAIMLIAVAITLLLSKPSRHNSHRQLALICAGFVIVASMYFLTQNFIPNVRSADSLAPAAATSITLLLLAISLGLLQSSPPASRGIAILIIFTSLLPLHRIITFIVGHGTIHTDGPFDSMSLPTAASLFLLACGSFLNYRLPFAGQLTSANLQGKILRLTLPWTILVPPFLAVLFAVGISSGLYNAEFVIVAVVAASCVMMTTLLWQLSQYVQHADNHRGEAERILRKSESYANQIIEAAPDAMVVVDEEGRIIRINARMEQLFAYHRDELLGREIEILLPERFRERHPEFLRSYFAEPSPRYMGEGRDLYAKRKDGSEVAVEIALAPLDTPQGRNVLANIADISGRLQAQAEIETALNEKTLLLNEIHHRVKNNLQIVGSLLSLQSSMVDNPDFSALIAESEGRVESMALMHQILYESKDFANVELDIYLHRLGSLLDQIYGATARGIRTHIDCQHLSLDLNRAIPLGLIVNELLSNAFKHAFPDNNGGDVWLNLHETPESMACLVVRDNGCGLPKEPSHEKRNSLGMQIISLLAEQIGATLVIGEGPSGCFELHFQTVHEKNTNNKSTPNKKNN